MPSPSRSLLYRAQAALSERLERFSRAVSPSAAMPAGPFSGAPQSPGNAPPINIAADQSPPPADPLEMRARYHDHTYASAGQPVNIGGFNVARMRAAIEVADTGASFLELSLFASAATRYAPVHTALAQCVAPVMDLPRYIRGGTEGIAKIVADEVEAQLCPSGGALSSIYFPTWLWGALAIEVSFMNFAVLQHVDGDPDPETGIRPRYSRRWPVWATTCGGRTYSAQTTEGEVAILNDGKFTLIADEELPHLNAPIRALGSPVMSGVLANQARDQYINLYGNPKPIGEMPDKVGVDTPEGRLFFRSMSEFRNPGGIILLPNGAKVTFAQLEGKTSTVFKDAGEEVWRHIGAVMLGSEGTMTPGTGGVYTSPTYMDVRRSINARRLIMIVRGINDGHIHPYVLFNYLASMQESIAAGTWKHPILDVPLPDPDKNTRIDADIKHMKAYTDQVVADRAAGIIVDKPRAEYIAAKCEVEPGTFAEKSDAPVARLDLAPTDIAKVVRVDEARKSQGLDAIGDDRGNLTISELDALTKAPAAAPTETTPEEKPVKEEEQSAP